MKTTLKFFFALLMPCVMKPAKSEAFYQGISFAEPANYNAGPGPKDSIVVTERDTSFMQINTRLKLAAIRLKEKAAEAKAYLTANNYNDDFCFLVDMSIPSGKRRFFVYNLKTDSVEFTTLVSHGSGSYKANCNDQLCFSNSPNSNATSLGKYKIGNSYLGKFGKAFKLYGMDSTNYNAYERAIVLHSDNYVPNTETYPYHIYESAGCPTVSPSALDMLSGYIRNSKKPVMLWVYN